MAQIKVSISNSSTVLTDEQVKAVIPALQTQVTRDFGPVWGIEADLDFVPKGQSAPPNHWWLVVLDDSDQAGALGYHDMTPQGLPLGKIFAGTDIEFKSQWTVTASHELLEMLGDPSINLNALWMTPFEATQNVVGRLYAYEVCDACEADADGYLIDGVLVSDFVYPTWFESFWQQGATQFDYQRKITSPFQLLPGGYINVYDMTTGTGWQQISLPTPNSDGRSARAPVGSRRERRRTPRNQWMRSNPPAQPESLLSALARAGTRSSDPVLEAAPTNGLVQILDGVAEDKWRNLIAKANREGFLMNSREGRTTQDGFTISWKYDAVSRRLSITCHSKPSWVSAEDLASGIRSLVADAAGAASSYFR